MIILSLSMIAYLILNVCYFVYLKNRGYKLITNGDQLLSVLYPVTYCSVYVITNIKNGVFKNAVSSYWNKKL